MEHSTGEPTWSRDDRPGAKSTGNSGLIQVAVVKTKTSVDQAAVTAAASQAKKVEGAAEEMGDEMPDIEVTDSDIEWLVPTKYASVRTSGLTIEVSKGMDPAKLDLTSQ